MLNYFKPLTYLPPYTHINFKTYPTTTYLMMYPRVIRIKDDADVCF